MKAYCAFLGIDFSKINSKAKVKLIQDVKNYYASNQPVKIRLKLKYR